MANTEKAPTNTCPIFSKKSGEYVSCLKLRCAFYLKEKKCCVVPAAVNELSKLTALPPFELPCDDSADRYGDADA